MIDLALLGYDDNSAIKERYPAEYVPEYERRFTSDEVAEFYRDNALPDQWYHSKDSKALETLILRIMVSYSHYFQIDE